MKPDWFAFLFIGLGLILDVSVAGLILGIPITLFGIFLYFARRKGRRNR